MAGRDSIDDIRRYYADSNEHGRAQIAQLEFAVTRALLARYLETPGRVLELGAGPGAYTRWLAKRGHAVTAVELVPELCEQNRAWLTKEGLSATVVAGDARDLATEVEGPFDSILVMGPLYHLTSLDEQRALLSSLRNLLRAGGLLVTTHVTRIGLIGFMLARFPTWAVDTPREVEHVMTLGHLPHHPRNGAFRGYWTTPEEVRGLHQALNLEGIRMHSQDPCIGSMDELFNRLPEEYQLAWAEVLTRVSADPLALGSGRSLLCVSRAPLGRGAP